ncbi:MAG: hypothetical protein JOZ69_15605 [Myxococcales bacterium]|nr:hypothetical protein [Myxococcales bacterium]
MAVERFRPAPPYRFDEPPHGGSLHYERSGFTLSGARWRLLARCASRRLGLGGGPI